MRKLLLAFAALSCFFIASAQTDETGIAKQLVEKNSAAIGLQAAAINDVIITNTYMIPGATDLRIVYLQQSYKGIPVFNELQVLVFKNNTLVSNTGSRIQDIEKRTTVKTANPAVTALTAVENSLRDAKTIALEQIVPVMVSKEGKKYEFGKLGAAVENITAELIWYPLENKNEVRLAWQVFLAPSNSSAYWLIRIDAMNGQVIGRQNLTITCNWDSKEHSVTEHIEKNHGPAHQAFVLKRDQQPAWKYSGKPFVVSSATYKVVPYPFESPNHMGAPGYGTATDPWLSAPGNATSLGWHYDGTTYFDSTRGNNVWAAEDRNNTNSVIDRAAVSLTPQPNLSFDFTPDYTQAPTVTSPTPNQQFNITNLFYWNNIMHDISYLYGFTEVGANFQSNNQGRGGQQNDYVLADAQDGGGSNNANFATPADGTRPRMQMYLWTAPNPDRDGDVDNSIVSHEYTHGISNRLTGGGSAGCLGNAEHGGEGWSDYYALMVTTNWATATITDGFNNPRGIGTYALNQPVTGLGIRSQRYCTNMAVNNKVYAASIPSAPHDRGEIWCMVLWEMTWEIIQQAGINPNLYNSTGVGGNSVALKLVTEGMRLQPCNPGFLDARNAILRADTLFFGAQYSCSIWRAFAKRGMGRAASQGSSSSVTDQVANYDVDNGVFTITQSAAAVPETQNVTYTNTLTAGICSAMTNYSITDTLPTSVTYVSGGSYNAGNRTITFGPINLAAGQTQTYPFTVTINPGTYFAPVTLIDEQVTGASIPAAWTATSNTANTWTVSTTQGNSAPNSFFATDPVIASDHRLASTSAYTLNATASSYTTLSFWHRFNTEDGWDGGVVEISTNGGGTWTDLGSKMVSGKYNGSLGTGSNNVIGGRAAFTGLTNTFFKTTINLASYAGQNINIRFRFSSDDNTAPAGGGWWVDDIVLYNEPAVYMKSNLFNGSSVLVSTTDTVTRILANVSCIPVSIATQPSSIGACAGGNASFAVTANGTTPITYQWQVNTGSGFTNIANGAPYSGATTATLSITGATAGMDGYQYRVVATNTCGTQTSSVATFSVTAVATITSQPTNVTACTGATATFTVAATGATSYQWQVNTGSGFTNIANGAPYSGVTTATLTITSVTTTLNGYQYRCVLTSCGPSVNTNTVTLAVFAPVTIVTHPVDQTVCEGSTATFTVSALGTITGYQWQVYNGTAWVDVTGATSATLTLTNVGFNLNTNSYRVNVIGQCGPVTTNWGTLRLNPLPDVELVASVPPVLVPGQTVSLTVVTNIPGGTVVWYKDGAMLPGVTGMTVTGLTVDDIGSYHVVYTTPAGCTSTSANRVISAENSDNLWVYPNPNFGQFQVRFNNLQDEAATVRVYDAKGALIYERKVVTGISYTRIDVNLGNISSGVYLVELRNAEGKRIGAKQIIVHHQ
jgi:hypothetical protein